MSTAKPTKKILLKEFMMLRMVHEAPIGEFSFVGNKDKNGNFGEVDRTILNHPKAIEKIKKKWGNTSETFNMWFLNDPKYRSREFKEVGEISRDKFREMTGSNIPDDQLDDGINIVYNGNTAAQKEQISGWILAHRFGHALQRDKRYLKSTEFFRQELAMILNQWARYQAVGNYYQDYYQSRGGKQEVFNKQTLINGGSGLNKDNKALVRNFLQQIGTFKSARDENIPRLNEFLHECFAQYLITNEVKFNELPDTFKIGTNGWGKSLRPIFKKLDILEIQELNEQLQMLARTLTIEFGGIVGSAVGNVYLI